MTGRSGDGDGHIATINRRYPLFLMLLWFQLIPVYFLSKALISPSPPSTTTFAAGCRFFLFYVSHQLFSDSLFLVYVHLPVGRLSPIRFLLGLLELVHGKPLKSDYRRRISDKYKLVKFAAFSGVYTSIAIVCVSGSLNFGVLGVRGFVVGLFYGSLYKTCIFDFPIVQRGQILKYKLGVVMAVKIAVRCSTAGYLVTLFLSVIIRYHYKGEMTARDLIMEQIVFYLACSVVFLCWELSCHLLEVIFTGRFIFAPPKGSIASSQETNPTDNLLAIIGDATSLQYLQYVAYYDLCMVSETNVDTWRRDAIFEKTGETYRKVIVACLKPLEQLTMDLASRLNEPFYDFQIFAWCARIATALTVRSVEEDHYGVASFTGSNTATVSTILSLMLAVETSMGKDTTTPVVYKKNSPDYSKAYSIADILRNSIYQIVSVFHHEMVVSCKHGRLQKDWITKGDPLYGSHELLVQKLQMFVEFEAN